MTTEQTNPNLDEYDAAMHREGLIRLAKEAVGPDNESPLVQLTAALHNRGIDHTSNIVWDSETAGLVELYQVVYVSRAELVHAMPLRQRYLASQPSV
ncbi:MAG: hypothetical protein Q8L34_00395 [Candidatus Woesearchaeota archaeon]|nr:hypothetical protein [Candidatus Woesearchaeota archaeon]